MNFNKYAVALALLATSAYAADNATGKDDKASAQVHTEELHPDPDHAGQHIDEQPPAYNESDIINNEEQPGGGEKKSWMGTLTSKSALIGYGVVGSLAVVGGGLYMYLGRKTEETDL